MTKKEKLYETLGELLFVIAKADGIIQDEEIKALESLVQNHTWAAQIQWSFDYEKSRNSEIETVYNKVINFCHSYGPAREYAEFIDAMTFVAKASNGIDNNENEVISKFSLDLIERFRRDTERLG